MDKFLGISQKKVEVNVNAEKTENTIKVEDTKVDLPWIEKYRPNNLDEVVYQKDIISSLKRSIFSGKLQHLLFYGPPGTGKTSTIIAVSVYFILGCKRNVWPLLQGKNFGIKCI